MLISSDCFRDIHRCERYKDLLKRRERLLSDIRKFERHEIPEDAYDCYPTPDIIYRNNLEYLGQLCGLIAEKYTEESPDPYR